MADTKLGIHAKLMLARTTIRSGKDAHNNFAGYDFRNAEKMLSGIKPILQAHGLTLDFCDDVVMIGARYYVKSALTVYDTESGEKHTTTALAREQDTKKGSDEAQITGAALTYAHKYALMSCFAISDPALDPDYQAGRPEQQAQQAPTPVPAKAATPIPPAPIPAQYGQLAPAQYGQQTGYQAGTYQQPVYR